MSMLLNHEIHSHLDVTKIHSKSSNTELHLIFISAIPDGKFQYLFFKEQGVL